MKQINKNNLKSENMKRKVQITAILLMLLISCSISLSAQRGIKHPADSTRMNHMRMASDSIHLNRMGDRTWMGQGMMDQMRYSMDRDFMYAMDMGMRPDYGMGGGFGPNPWDSFSNRQSGLAGMILGSIPNVTEAQKKQITDLMTKQQAEMKKLREEMQAKMQALRDTHRKNVLNVLTDEQKKFVESKEKNNPPAPGKTE
jgi:Spy/CpxP family protein refolding chaperone